MNKLNFLVAAMLLLIAPISQAAEVVGVVGYMNGSLVAKRADGTVKIMGTKSEVQAGDLLGTGTNSYAQIQMNDGAKMTLRPNSNLKVVEYKFNREEPQSDNAVFSLLKGGLRSVTGLIGKRGDPDAYKIQTKIATIGIRGTDFSARLCATDNCQDDVAAPPAKLSAKSQVTPLQAAWSMTKSLSVWKILALPLKAMVTSAAADDPPSSPAGLYVTVHTGQVLVAQPTGNTLSLGRGETGFANQAALIRLPAPPAFMARDTKQTDAVAAKAAKAEEKAGNKADDGKVKGKSDKEKDSGKSGKEKDSGKPDEGKAGGSSDGGTAPSSSDGGTAPSSSDGGTAPSSSGAGKDIINPDAGNAASPNTGVGSGGCVVGY